MAGKKSRSGRRLKPANERSDVAITAWMLPEDKALIAQAAALARVPTGRWLGNVGLERARAILGLGGR